MDEIAKKQKEILDLLYEGHYHSPGMQAAAEYIARILLGEKHTQGWIAYEYKVSQVTIRNNFHKLLARAESMGFKWELKSNGERKEKFSRSEEN